MIRRALLMILWLAPSAPAVAQGDTRLMILHDHADPVVSEMVHLLIRGEYDLTVTLEDMTFPDSPDYDWIQIARDRWFREHVNGRLLQIFEREVAVFPRRAGAVPIGPLSHDLTYIAPDRQRARTRVTAPVATLAVAPFPGEGRPLSASQLVLIDELSADPANLRQDEVLTRRVTIEAMGSLSHFLPPRPDIRQPWMVSFTLPEQRETILTEQGPVARVVWEWQMRPHTGEPAILPGMGLPWFDTASRRVEVAALKPIPFGFAGFGANFGAMSDAGRGTGRLMAGIVLLAFAGGLALLTAHRSPIPRAALRARLRRHLPSPDLRRMKIAARAGDMPALRAAGDRYLIRLGLPSHLLAELDRQLYAKDRTAGFSPQDWLRGFRKAVRRMPASGNPAPR